MGLILQTFRIVWCRWKGISPSPVSGFKGRDSPMIVIQLRQAGGIQSADG